LEVGVAEREDMNPGSDRTDASEKRDWDIEAAASDDASVAGTPEARPSAAPGETEGGRGHAVDEHLEPHEQPADESERRDWDVG
jgi:hypothetical protein